MVKNRLSFNFILFSFIGLCIYITQKSDIQLPWFINNYVNDFLIIPIVLSVCLFVLRWIRNDKSFMITSGVIIYVVVLYAVFFEVLMPRLSERYTADVIDFLMYVLGGIWFWVTQKNYTDSLL